MLIPLGSKNHVMLKQHHRRGSEWTMPTPILFADFWELDRLEGKFQRRTVFWCCLTLAVPWNGTWCSALPLWVGPSEQRNCNYLYPPCLPVHFSLCSTWKSEDVAMDKGGTGWERCHSFCLCLWLHRGTQSTAHVHFKQRVSVPCSDVHKTPLTLESLTCQFCSYNSTFYDLLWGILSWSLILTTSSIINTVIFLGWF